MYLTILPEQKSYHDCLFQTFRPQYAKAGSEKKLQNLKNIFLINNQHSLKSYKLGNIENLSKEVFF